MAKDFEETVLKKLDELSVDVKTLKSDVGTLKSDVGGLKEDVSILKSDVRNLEVLHEETKEKIEQVIEIGKAQKELWEKSATKEDVYENQSDNKLTRSVVKTHTVAISDHERRLKRLEIKASAA